MKRKELRSLNRYELNSPINYTSTPTKTTEIHVASEAIEVANHPVDPSCLGHRPASSKGPVYSVAVSSRVGNFSVPLSPKNRNIESARSEQHQMPRHLTNMDRVLWSYTKVALLFFTAMLVTWIPSSANRIYSLVHPGYISPALQFAAAFVLPLQGFWNAIIYITTSWHACRCLFSRSHKTLNNPLLVNPISSRNQDKSHETESTTELASQLGRS
jgi:hypothetical protein